MTIFYDTSIWLMSSASWYCRLIKIRNIQHRAPLTWLYLWVLCCIFLEISWRLSSCLLVLFTSFEFIETKTCELGYFQGCFSLKMYIQYTVNLQLFFNLDETHSLGFSSNSYSLFWHIHIVRLLWWWIPFVNSFFLGLCRSKTFLCRW